MLPGIKRLKLPLGVTAAAVLLSSLAVAPAHADDHPPIFTFSAERDGGNHVTYSGRYAVWDAAAQVYKASNAVHVAVEQYIPAYEELEGTPWDSIDEPRAVADGTFNGSFTMYPSATLRARASVWDSVESEYKDVASTSSVQLSYSAPMPVELLPWRAYQLKKNGDMRVNGFTNPTCYVLDANDSQGYCPLTRRVQLQGKIKGKWKKLATWGVPIADMGKLGEIKVKNASASSYRLYLPGDRDYKTSYSPVFKPAKKAPAAP